jgi:nucleotide-binding universal stress UspA family protein
MKKIIAAFDGLKYSKSTRDYALYIAGQTKAHLVGVFLDDPTYTSYKIYELISDSETSVQKMKKLDEKDKAAREAAASDFERSCSEQKLEYSLHHDRKVAISDLKHETIYADLLIINSSETLTHYVEKPPTRFIREILEDAQCPVLLVPPKFKKAEKIKLLYDGAPSSVHAIKMFSYMLPQLKTLDTEVISVKPYGQTLHLPDTKLMKEFMKRHFPKATYTVLKGFPEVEIMKYLRETGENSFVVLGAYRRGFISRWFHESMADTIMKDLKLPLFIAHSK